MKRGIKMAAWLICAAAVAWAFVQQTAISRIRSENLALRGATEEARRLTRENAEIDRLREANQELDTLRRETRDLHRLRNEVRQLREQVRGSAQVRSENQRLKATASARSDAATVLAAPAAPMTLAQVAYLGTETPEATLQSFLWAIRQGDLQAFRNCLTPERQKEMESRAEDEVRASLEEMKRQLKAFQIMAKKEISADEVQLGLQLESENQPEPAKSAVTFKRIAYEWKLDVVP